MAERDITIQLNAIDNASGVLQGFSANLEKLTGNLDTFVASENFLSKNKAFINQLDQQGFAIDNLGNVIDPVNKRMVDLSEVVGGYKKNVIEANAANEKLDKFFNGFPAQLLSIGFLFGSIGATATSFVKQALASFESLGSTLTEGRMALLQMQAELNLLLLSFAESQAMKDFLDFLKGIIKAFTDLDPATQNQIFNFIIWGGAIATVLGALGFLSLGVIGIVQLFGLFAPLVGGISTALGAASISALGLAAAIFGIALALGFISGHGDKVIEALGFAFKGLGNIIDGLLTGDLPKLQLGFAQLAFSLIEIFLTAGVGLLQIANKIVGFLIEIFATFFIHAWSEFINFFITQLNQVINAVKALAQFLGIELDIQPLQLIGKEQINAAKSAFTSFISTNVGQVDEFWNGFLDSGLSAWQQFLGITGSTSIPIAPGALGATTATPSQTVNQVTVNNDFSGVDQGQGIFGFATYEDFKNQLFADLEELINTNTGS